MESNQVTIIGAGLAGLFLANELASRDISVLLVDRKESLAKGIHTTGIFVRKTFEDFEFPEGTLGRAISGVSLYSPRLEKIELESGLPEFRVGNMGLLYETLLDQCVGKGVKFLCGTRFLGAVEEPACEGTNSIVSLEKSGKRVSVNTKVLVGGDGTVSDVARNLGLDQNREWIVGYEEVFKGIPLDGEPRLHCFLDNELAPGYLAWISNDGEETHIGVGGYPSRFDPREALRVFKRTKVPTVFQLEKRVPCETRGGRIPVGGVLKRIANKRGLLIGDAAGAVSPLTAGGLDPCLRLSKFAAEVIVERFESGNTEMLLNYSGSMFRSKFRSRILLRLALKANRTQIGLEAAFKLLKSKPGMSLAEKIFYRRASFPDSESAQSPYKKQKPNERAAF